MSTSIPKIVIFVSCAIVIALSAGCASPYPSYPFGNQGSNQGTQNLNSMLTSEGSPIRVAVTPTSSSSGSGATGGSTGSSSGSTTGSSSSDWLTGVTNPVSQAPATSITNYLYGGVVTQEYVQFAAYNPDFSQPGPQFWAEMIFYGRPLRTQSSVGIENSFISSPYVQSLASGAGGDTDFVFDANADCITMFGNVFGATASIDKENLQTWASTIYSDIKGGQTEASVLQNTFYDFEQAAGTGSSSTPVYYTYPIVQLYRGYLNQMPSQATLQNEIQAMADGTGWADIRNSILSQSSTIGGDSAINIISVFRTVLGCLPTSSSLQYWLTSLGDTTQINSMGYYNKGLYQLAQVLLNVEINGAGSNANVACQND